MLHFLYYDRFNVWINADINRYFIAMPRDNVNDFRGPYHPEFATIRCVEGDPEGFKAQVEEFMNGRAAEAFCNNWHQKNQEKRLAGLFVMPIEPVHVPFEDHLIEVSALGETSRRIGKVVMSAMQTLGKSFISSGRYHRPIHFPFM